MEIGIGVRANFFPGVWAIFSRKSFPQHPKNCYTNLQNYFARLTPPSKIPDFGHFISLDRMNSFRVSFNKYKKIFFHFWLLASARKITALPESGPPVSYAYGDRPLVVSNDNRIVYLSCCRQLRLKSMPVQRLSCWCALTRIRTRRINVANLATSALSVIINFDLRSTAVTGM